LTDAGLAHPRPPLGAGPSRDDVAVVIPVRDDPDGLRRTCATLEPVAQLVVVDDGSCDPAAVAAAARTATLLRHSTGRGPAAARNTGYRACDRQVVAFVDADVELDDGWLEPLLAHFADPLVSAVAPRVVASPGGAPATLARYDAARSSLDLGARPALVRPLSRVPYVPATVLLVRREALAAAGGFDEALRYGEDVDLVWRLHRQRGRVRYEPGASVRHPTRASYGGWIRQRIAYGSSAARLASRHGAAVAPVVVSGWTALAWAAAARRRPAVSALVVAATASALVPKLRASPHPVAEAGRIVGRGNLAAGRQLAGALWRPWWPATALLAFRAPRARPALLLAHLVPAALEWRERRPAMGFARYAALRAADDAAYSAGVWLGCLRARSARALVPRFSSRVTDVPRLPVAVADS
jgi:mycofactocin system glycosyltransferase